MKIDLKKIKPVLKPKNRKAKDPIRFPRVINAYEGQSKKDFHKSLSLEFEMLTKEIMK